MGVWPGCVHVSMTSYQILQPKGSINASGSVSIYDDRAHIATYFPHFLLSLGPTLSHKVGVRRCALAPICLRNSVYRAVSWHQPLSVISVVQQKLSCCSVVAEFHLSVFIYHNRSCSHTLQGFSRPFQLLDRGSMRRRCGQSCAWASSLCQTTRKERVVSPLLHLSEGGFCL